MRIVCISDTHCMHARIRVPDGDVLVHAGDMTMRGDLAAIANAGAWLASLPHEHKVVIAGNHDWAFQETPAEAIAALRQDDSIHYLQDSAVELGGLQFYGSPWQPEFCNWAFNLPRNEHRLRKVWESVPNNTDVLVSHGPPHGILDRCPDRYTGCLISVGDEVLMRTCRRVRPRLHVFGHIHEGYGSKTEGPTQFVNASICTGSYAPSNAPVVVDM